MFGNSIGLYPYKQMGLLNLLKSKINIGTILTNTQKTLNIVNQAILIVYQVKPLVNNAKTFIKVVNAVNTNNKKNTYEKNKTNNYKTQSTKKDPVKYNSGPNFFL